MAQERKRQGTTVKFASTEKRVLRQAAQLEGLGWTTYARNKAVGCARRQVKRDQEQKAKAASGLTR